MAADWHHVMGNSLHIVDHLKNTFNNILREIARYNYSAVESLLNEVRLVTDDLQRLSFCMHFMTQIVPIQNLVSFLHHHQCLCLVLLLDCDTIANVLQLPEQYKLRIDKSGYYRIKSVRVAFTAPAAMSMDTCKKILNSIEVAEPITTTEVQLPSYLLKLLQRAAGITIDTPDEEPVTPKNAEFSTPV